MPSPLELTVIMPDCGEKLHAALVEDGDGYVIHAEDWVLHVPPDMSVRGVVEAIRAVHMMRGHQS